jgi:hypothetical protein
MINDAERMGSFCSIGGNCEFGAAQRTYGAEPHDLLWWAISEMGILLKLLAERFEGIGDDLEIDPQMTSSEVMGPPRNWGSSGNRGWRGYVVRWIKLLSEVETERAIVDGATNL